MIVRDGEITILRPGWITREDIIRVVGHDTPVRYSTDATIRAPGTRYRHYAPRARIEIVTHLDTSFLGGGGLVAAIGTDAWLTSHHTILDKNTNIRIFSLGDTRLADATRLLYAHYREIDRLGIGRILIEDIAPDGVGYALMDRIRRSAQ